jgi:DNA polymerase-3 subunit gamma/tau
MHEFYKRYRPLTFDAVIGNKATVASLNGFLDKGTLPHSILLHGPSGCGKTTIGRILASELDCNEMDFTEMDSGSFRGIDSIRDIRDQMSLAPLNGTCRVWLIDECHKMTNDAQNAFLKSLEDTPAHVYFILCTTDPQKMIKAIQTRCTQFAVELLTPAQVGAELLTPVCTAEGLTIPKDILKLIARGCEGSARTALVALEQVASITDEAEMRTAVQAILVTEESSANLANLVLKNNWKEAAVFLKAFQGDAESQRRGVLGYFQAVLLNSGDESVFNKMICFEKDYFNTGKAGLTMSVFEACHKN